MKHIHNLKTNIPLLMKGRRLTAFFLSVLMILTVLPTTVYAGSVGSSADDKSVGKDTVQNASTTYKNVEPGSADTNVYLTVDNGAIVVGTPTSVILNGSADAQGKYTGNYSIYAKGDIAGDQVLSIYPETNMVAMMQTGKENKSASVSQMKTEFSSQDIVDGMTTTGMISAESLSAGSWNGNFNFVISVNTNPIPDGYTTLYEYDLSATENDNVKAYYAVPTKNTTPVNVGTSSETASANLVSSIASLFKPMTAYAATGDVIEYNGVRYELSDEDTLIITGTGNMIDNLTSKMYGYQDLMADVEQNFDGVFSFGINEDIEKNLKVGEGYYIFYNYSPYPEYCERTTSNSYRYQQINLNSNMGKYITQIKDNYITDLPKTVVIKDGITNISKEAFANAFTIESVTIPSSVKTIEERAFFACSGLTDLTIPEGVTNIGEYAFYNCGNLTNITIPNSVTSIGNYSFSNNGIKRSIISVTIPDSVTSIGTSAFAQMASGSIIYCQSQAVADLLNRKYTTSYTAVVVDASKF